MVFNRIPSDASKEKPNIKISDKDKKDRIKFISNLDTIEDKDQKYNTIKNKNRIFDLKVDLHGLN